MELVQNFCYLGLDITASGSFHIAKSNLRDKGIKAMYPLIDTVIKFELKVEQSIDLFKRLISPILLYGSEIWSTLTQHQLKTISNDSQELGFYMVNANSETVHLKFLKIVMGLKRNARSMAVLGDSGQYPVSVIAYLNLLKYWHRICHLDDSCLVKKALNEITSIPDSKCDWKATVKTILNICSMEDVWENPLQFSINDLKVRFKRKLELFFEKYWKSKIDAAEIGNKGNSKLRYYKMFKNKFSKEEYLSIPIKFNIGRCLQNLDVVIII